MIKKGITTKCSECQKKVYFAPWQVKRNSRFCSRKCKYISLEVKSKIGKSNKVAVKKFYDNGGISPVFKGNEAGYFAKHIWIAQHFGIPQSCEHCGKIGKKSGRNWNIQYANKSKKYLRDINDWLRLCVKCHRAYDKQAKTLVAL